MKKLVTTMIFVLVLGMVIGGVSVLSAPAQAQQTMFSKFPALDDAAAWAEIETRRQARLDKVQGVTEFNAGNYGEAVKLFEKFSQVFPNDPEGMKFLALAKEWAAKAK